jgi:hypothetical protein
MKVTSRKNKLTLRDFAFVREPEIGLTYQNGPYMIHVGRGTYACSYKGLTFSWGHESILEAVRAVEKHSIKTLRGLEQ